MSLSGKRFLSEAEKSKKPEKGINAEWDTISRLYKDAPNKNKQIEVLSQLYLKSQQEIAQYLFDHGYDDKYIRSKLK